MLVPTFLATFRWGHRGSPSGLGLTQYSLRHSHLALTAQRFGDFLLRGLPRMLWSPSSFEGKGKRGVHGTGHQFQQLLLHSVICRRCGARANRYSHLILRESTQLAYELPAGPHHPWKKHTRPCRRTFSGASVVTRPSAQAV